MSQPAFDDWDDEEDFVPSGAPQAGIVVAGVTGLVVGLAALVIGALVAIRGSIALDVVMRQANLQGSQAEQVRSIAITILSVLALVLILFGVAAIVAGVGVLKRLAWARTLSIVLAFIAGGLAVLCLVVPNPYGLVPFGAHALVMLLVLNDKDYSYQFR